MYSTLKATVRQGKIELLEAATLPENSMLLVVVLDDVAPEGLSLGEHLIAGLQDVQLGRVTEVNTEQELADHLDTIFGDT
ncbi:MAG: hypothetical protein H6632_16990 [Anaerolineales bacterium]|nr:hypothetical protein [Anaerolineales bacterium]